MIVTRENLSTGRETCHSSTVSTANPTTTDMNSNLSLRVYKPATIRLSHDKAPEFCLSRPEHVLSIVLCLLLVQPPCEVQIEF